MPYAHSRNVQGQRHDLVAHLRSVAQLTASFASSFGAAELGCRVGLWHDVGKFSQAFQDYLRDCDQEPDRKRRGPDHKATGSRLARERLGLPALVIQGHHGGLRSPTDLESWLNLQGTNPAVEEALNAARAALPDLDLDGVPPLPDHLTDPRSCELFLRLLFSALVDADFLDTEAHYHPEHAAARDTAPTLDMLWRLFKRDQARFAQPEIGPVNRTRHAIYEACLAAAERSPGLFRLTVPTGGGKTRSALAFALRHALRHGHQRVIVAVPFISITEQTADVYRGIFAPDYPTAVLEHHSGVEVDAADESEDGDFRRSQVWSRLAAENWDAPIIVTTTVQLFESLFDHRPGRCRKVHRLANSVIILDEAQALPPGLLQPILDALMQLTQHYGTTVVLSTATQPAFESIPAVAKLAPREIVPDPARHFEMLRRVKYEWKLKPKLAWSEVAALLREERQGLAVVNTKKDALALLDALDDPEALHLSTLLCGAHRRAVIGKVRQRLKDGLPCRLVSTQVIEAGVDLDFRLVLRAFGPLDGIIQAAGRCNREGKLKRLGQVVVFQPAEGGLPPGSYKTATGITRTLHTSALLNGGSLDPDDLDTARQYFQRLFPVTETDAKGVQERRGSLDYPEVADRFRMIDDATESVVITCYGDRQERVREILEHLRGGDPQARQLRRELQPYIVALYTQQAAQYRRRGLISEVSTGLGEWHGTYDQGRGLTGEGPDPDMLVV